MRSARSFSCALVFAALVSAACSSQTDATTYVDGVCTALTDWQSGLETGNEALESTLSGGQPTPEDTKTALVDFLSATVEGTQTMVTDIEDLGVPDVDGGDEIASTLSSALGEVVTLFQGTLDDVEGLATDDPQAMASALGELGTDITEGSAGIGTALGDLDTPELEEAAKDSDACQALGAGA